MFSVYVYYPNGDSDFLGIAHSMSESEKIATLHHDYATVDIDRYEIRSVDLIQGPIVKTLRLAVPNGR